MKKDYSIRRKKDFQNVYKRGKATHTSLFLLKVAKNNLSHSRFAFIISKSVHKNASVRNTLRRRVREWVRRNYTTLFSDPRDILFLFKKETTRTSRKRLYEELSKIFQRYNT